MVAAGIEQPFDMVAEIGVKLEPFGCLVPGTYNRDPVVDPEPGRECA